MHQHLIDHLTAPAAGGPSATLAVVSGAATYMVWVLLSGAVALVAVIRVLRQPVENWSHRNWSKLAWVLAILYLAPPLGGYPIPVGAVAAMWRTRRRPAPQSVLGQLPMATGTCSWPWPWDAK